MKTLFAAVSAIGLLAASPAYADVTGTGEIALNATVAPACGIDAHKSGAQSAPGWDQNDITVDLTNGGNGQFIGQTETNRSFGNVWCNNAATVTISVAALTSSATTTDTGSFTNRFDVKVTTDAGVYVGEGTDFVLNTAGTAGTDSKTGNTGGAFETGLQNFGGADSIEILQDATNRRAVAGTYSGSVTFTATTS